MTTITKFTISNLLFDHGVDIAVAQIMAADATYALPAKDWINNEYRRAFSDWISQTITLYSPGDSDCDDYAEAAAFFARFLHRRTPNRPKASAIAFGEFYYTRWDKQGHAINIAICRVSEAFELVFFEPQTAQIITLNKQEIESCGYVRI